MRNLRLIGVLVLLAMSVLVDFRAYFLSFISDAVFATGVALLVWPLFRGGNNRGE